MSEFGIKVNLKLDTSDLDKKIGQLKDRKIPVQIDLKGASENVDRLIKQLKSLDGLKVNPIKFESISGATKSFTSELSKIKNAASDLGKINVSNSVKDIADLESLLRKSNFNDGAIQNITKDIKEMGVTVNKVTTNLTGAKPKIQIQGVDELGRVVTLASEFKTILSSDGKTKKFEPLGAFTTKITQVNSSIKETSEAYARMKKILQEMNSINSNAIKLNLNEDKSQIETYTKQINNLEREYNELLNTFGKNLSTSQLDKLSHSFDENARKIERIESKMRDVERKNSLKIKDGLMQPTSLQEQDFKNLMNVINELNSKKIKLNGLDASNSKTTKYASELTSQIQKLQLEYNNLVKTFGKDLSPGQWNQINEAMSKANRNISLVQSSKADKAVLQDQMQQYEKLNNFSKKIKNLKIEIGGLKGVSGNENEIAELEKQLERFKRVYDSLRKGLQQNLTAPQLRNLTHDMLEAENELRKIEAKQKDVQQKSANNINLKFDNGTYEKEMNDVSNSLRKLDNASDKTKASMKELNAAFKELQAARVSGDAKSIVSSEQKYQQALKKTKNQIDINIKAEKQLRDQEKLVQGKKKLSADMGSWLRDNSKAAKQFGRQIRELQTELKNCDSIKFNGIKQQFNTIKSEAKAAGLTGQTFFDDIKGKISEVSTYLIGGSLLYQIPQVMSEAFENVKNIDSAMTELKKVTDETAGSYQKFLSKDAVGVAKEVGASIDDVVNSTADFARLGYTFDESIDLARTANIYNVVGDGLKSVEDATQSVVSTMKAFDVQAENSIDVVDKFNNVSNQFSISSGGIGEALKRSASSLASSGNDLDQSIALITAANEIAQDPTRVGNGFKTISMRLRELSRAKELENLSGISAMLDENTFKSTYQILDELSRKWDTFSDKTQAQITEVIAGKTQGNILLSTVRNFDQARAALEESQNSAGSAERELAKYSESLESHLNKLHVAFQSLSQTTLDSNFLKGAIDGVTEFINIIDTLVDKIGVLPTLLLGKGLANVGKGITDILFDGTAIQDAFPTIFNTIDTFNEGRNAAKIAKMKKISTVAQVSGSAIDLAGETVKGVSAANAAKNLSNLGKDAAQIEKQLVRVGYSAKSASAAVAALSGVEAAASVATAGMATAETGATVATTGLSGAMAGLNAVISANPIAAVVVGIMALIGAGYAAVKVYDAMTESYSEAIEKAQESSSKYKDSKTEVENLNNELETTNQKISQLESKGKLTLTEESELAKLRAQRNELEVQLKLKEKINDFDKRNAKRDVEHAIEKKKAVVDEDNGMEVSYKDVNIIEETKDANEELLKTEKKLQELREKHANTKYETSGFFEEQTKWEKEEEEIGELEEKYNKLTDTVTNNLDTLSDFRDTLDGTGSKYVGEIDRLFNQVNLSGMSELDKELANIQSFFNETGNDSIYNYLLNIAEGGGDAAQAAKELGVNLDELGISDTTLNRYFDELTTSVLKASDAVAEFDGSVSSVEKAFESANAGADYAKMTEFITKAKQLKDAGKVGTDDFKSVAEWISPNIVSTKSNIDKKKYTLDADAYVDAWEKAYKKVSRYFGESESQSMINLRDDLVKIGYATKDTDGLVTWTKNFKNTAGAAKELGISTEALETALHNLEDYGFEFKGVQFSQESLKKYESALDGVKKQYEKMKDSVGEEDPYVKNLGKMIKGWDAEYDRVQGDMSKLTEDKIIKIKFEYNLAEIQNAINEAESRIRAGDESAHINKIVEQERYVKTGSKETGLTKKGLQIPVEFTNAQENIEKLEKQLANTTDNKERVKLQVEIENQQEIQKNIIDLFREEHPEITPKSNMKDFQNAWNEFSKQHDYTIDVKADNTDAIDKVMEVDNKAKSISPEVTLKANVKQTMEDFSAIKKEVEEKGIDLNKTVYGNIDTNNRQVLNWDDSNLKKFKSEYESWGYAAKELEGTISTVMGTAATFDGLDIAFTPMLQTDHGAELLSSDTVYSYINTILGKLSSSGKDWSTEDLLKLDAKGLEVDGKKVKNLIADVGDEAIKTSEAMHYTGKDGGYALAEKELKGAKKALKEYQDQAKQSTTSGTTTTNTTTNKTTNVVESKAEGLEATKQQISEVRREAEKPAYMKLNVMDVEAGLRNVLVSIQNYQKEKEKIDYIVSKPQVDTKQLQEANTMLDTYATQLAHMPESILIKAGFDTSDLSTDSIKKQLDGDTFEFGVEFNPDTSKVKEAESEIQNNQIGKTVEYGTDTSKPDGYDPEDKKSEVIFGVNHTWVDNYRPGDKNGTVKYSASLTPWEPPVKHGKVIYTTVGTNPGNTNKSRRMSGSLDDIEKPSKVNGNAYSRGKWGAKKTEEALVGELGKELVVDVKSGTWHTVGNNGAEFSKINKGDIVFNHLQTEELLKYGKVISSKKRGKALVSGTAYANTKKYNGGRLPDTIVDLPKDTKQKVNKAADAVTKAANTSNENNKKQSSTKSKTSTKKSSTSKDKDKDDKKKDEDKLLDRFKKYIEKLFDWIEIKVSRQSDKIDNYISKAETAKEKNRYNKSANYYRRAINATSEQIDIEYAASKRYEKQANNVLSKASSLKDKDGNPLLSEKQINSIRKKVASGSIDIKKYNERQREVIKAYQEWYDKSKDAKKAITDLQKNIRTYTDNIKELVKAMADLRREQRDAKLEKIQKVADIATSGYAYTFRTKNSQLNEQSSSLRKQNAVYNNDLKKARTQTKSTGKNSKSVVNSQLKVIKHDGGKNAKKYRQALNNAKSAINQSKKVSSSDLKTIKNNSVETYAELVRWNEQVDELKNTQLERDLAVAQNNATITQNKQEWYNNKQDYFQNQNNLYKQKADNTVKASNKNVKLEKASAYNQKILNNDKKRITSFNKDQEKYAKRINSYNGHGSSYKNKGSKGKKTIDSFIKKIKNNYVNKGITIPADLIEDLENYHNRNLISDAFYNACKNWNDSIQGLKEAKEIAEANKQTVLQDNREIGQQMFDNIQQEYTNKQSEIKNAATTKSLYNSVKKTKGFDLHASDIQLLIHYSMQEQASYSSEVSKLEQQIKENVSSGKWKEYSQEWWDAKNAVEEYRQKIIECEQAQEEYNNELIQLPYTVLDRVINRLQAAKNNLNSVLTIRSTKGIIKTESDIQNQISAENAEIEKQIEKRTQLMHDMNNSSLAGGAYGGKTTEQWYTEFIEADTAVNELTNSVEELGNEIIQLPFDQIERNLKRLDAIASENKSISDLTKARGIDLQEVDYTQQMTDNVNKMVEYRTESAKALENYQKALADKDGVYGGKTAEQWQTQAREANVRVNELLISNEELKDALRDDVYWRNFERAHKAAKGLADILSGISSLISDDMLFNKDGKMTDFGASKLATTIKQYENARTEVENYTKDIENLNNLYRQGYYNQDEFNAKLTELQGNLFNSASSMKSYIDSIIEMNKKLAKAELDALLKLIDERKEALQRKKSYYDFDDTIKDKTKDIKSLEAQAAALENVETAEAKAQRAKLNAQISEKREDLDKTIRDHSFELSQDALDELKDLLQEEFDDHWNYLNQNLDEVQKLLQASNELSKANAANISAAIEKLLEHYGINSTSTELNYFGDYVGYASGSKKVDKNKYAWTQENGDEIIIRKSDGAILTPLSKGDSVIPSSFTNNLFDLGRYSVDELKQNIVGSIPTLPNAQQSVTTINNNYDSLLNVEGNVDSTVVTDLNKFAKTFYKGAYDYTMQSMSRDLRKSGMKV